jgi:crotonobetainyl-CoA:carnitine CoA-transferase CaiB-like acyl-CoA transferase
VPQPQDRRNFINPLINCYRDADGRWIWLLMLEGDRHWPDFCRAVEHEEWMADPRFETIMLRAGNAEPLVTLIDEVIASRTAAEWAPIFDAHNVWWAPVQTLEEVIADPLVAQAGAWVDVPMAEGEPAAKMVATPTDFAGTPWVARAGAPELGQHSEEVLLELGYDWDRIIALKDGGVIP